MSANSLKLYRLCSLRFKLRYSDGLYLAVPPAQANEEQRALERGEQFHLMARRYYAGLDPATLADLESRQLLGGWMQALQASVPLTSDRCFYPELELRLNRPEMRLMATFDLLVVEPDGRATIYDWKTHQRMPGRRFFQSSLQTLVYRYMLCAAGGSYSPRGQFEPEQVTMVYWNPHCPERAERLTYSQVQYKQDEEFLRHQLASIYATPPDGFSPTLDLAVCTRCEYQSLCHGGGAVGLGQALAVDAMEGAGSDEVDVIEEEWSQENAVAWDRLPELP